MIVESIANYHFQYMDVSSQHWSFSSEKLAGGDNLLTALSRGWQLDDTVKMETVWYAGMRSSTIYHFTLVKGEQEIRMPVLSNPYVNRMVKLEEDLKVVPIDEAADKNPA